MAWIPLYLNKLDEKELLTFLNQEEEIAFILSNGDNNWKAVKTINEFPEQRIVIWHIPSGKLPLLTPDDTEEWIDEPFNGWTEKRKGADERTPYFGAGWPGVIHLNLRTNNENKIGMSSFEWIGNHYSIIGISASETTKRFWNRLRRQIKKRSIQITRAEREGWKPEIFAFNGETSVEVTFEKESVWLNQNQLSDLFGRDRTVVGRHIRNIFKEGELEEEVVSADFAHTTQHGAISGKKQTRLTKFYNLDVIISVGYRVKSIQGTHFRQWANKRLNEYLIQGYSVNNKRLQQLQNSFKLLKGITENQEVQKPLIKEVIEVLTDYAFGLDILDGYDHQNLTIENINSNTAYRIKYKDAKEAIEQLRDKFGGGKLFGNEKDNSFRSSISSIDQTFAGFELYKSIEEKAANLLYFVVKKSFIYRWK